MAYYRGDYYRGHGRGDYYRGHGRGDPFWGALWTGIKTVGGALLGIRPAAPAVTPPLVAPGPSPAQTALASMASGLQAGMMIRRPTMPTQMPMIRSGVETVNRMLVERPDGSVVAVGRRRRRMNPANPQALRRSIRRVVGFGRLAMRSKKAIGKAATAMGVKRSVGFTSARRKR